MFTFKGSLTVAVLSLIAAVALFSSGKLLVGMMLVPVIVIAAVSTFLAWADMGNV